MKNIIPLIAVCSFALLYGCASKSISHNPLQAIPANNALPYRMVAGEILDISGPQLAVGKSTPFNWGYSLIDSTGISIQWKGKINTTNLPFARFRLSTATDVRESCVLEVKLAKDNTTLGQLDISYATYLQVYEIILPQGSLQKLLKQGVTIRQIKSKQPAGIFTSSDIRIPEIFRPHLLLYNKATPGLDDVKRTILYGNVYQPFGWMEGVVMDGLQVLSANEPISNASLQSRFGQYFDSASFSYTGLFNTLVSNRVMNVETILPFALYARYHPAHPSLEKAIEFCIQHKDASGVISDDPKAAYPVIKTEECYTVSYPLAVIGQQRGQQELNDLAVKNLLARATALANSSGIYQRTNNKGGREYRNWSRGVAWYLLGFIRSWEQLKTHPDADKIKAEIIRAASYVIQFQNQDGMWYCFMHEPETGVETSGTAGIAAALMYAHQLGILDDKAAGAADKATAGLLHFLTPDGLLTGTAQVNKGGEALQRSGYRVISPYTLGFFGYLLNGSEIKKKQLIQR